MNYVMRCRSGYFRSSDPEGLLAWCEAHNEHIQLVWRHTTDAHLVPDYSRKLPPEPRDYVYALLMESGTPDYRSMLDHEIEVTLGDRNIDPTAEAVAAFKETAEFEEEDFDWNPSEIASYMEDDQIVIFTWSGHEGMRYCDGGAFAVHAPCGEMEHLCTNDIYNRVRSRWPDADFTEASR